MTDFLEQMNSQQFKKIENFFTTMPKLSHEVTIVNPKTKKKSTVVLEGLSSFSIGMVHMDLENYYKLNFALMQYHKYKLLTEIENLIPWERDIYVALLQQHLEEEELKAKQRNENLDTQTNVDKEINEGILRTYLGVDDPTDIDFDTYRTLLREKIAAARMGGSDMDSGDISYLTNEFIRIKKIEVPEGQKKKKIDINKFVKKAEEKKKS